MRTYLLTFDLHGATQPPGDLYTGIYDDLRRHFSHAGYCKDFGQFCLLKTANTAHQIKQIAKQIIDRRSNRFTSRDIVVFLLGNDAPGLSRGEKISISRGTAGDEDLRDFRRFFVETVARVGS